MTLLSQSTATSTETPTSTMVLVGTTKGLFTLRSVDGSRRLRAVRTDVRRRGGVRHVHRLPLGRDPAVRRIGQQPLGSGAAALRRPRRDLDRGRAGGAAPSRATPGPRWPGSGSSRPARPTSRTCIYAGVEPAALFRSDDGGRSFALVRGLVGPPAPHPVATGRRRAVPAHRPRPPARPRAAADRHLGGRACTAPTTAATSWRASNRGHRRRLPSRRRGPRVRPVRAQGGARRRRPRAALPPAPRRHLPQRRRRRTRGQPMTGIAGMDFGFPVVAHPTRPSTAYLLPLESDEYRCTPDGRCTRVAHRRCR